MLELKNIKINAGNVELLKAPISVKEVSEQTIVFFGRNGAGKTTLLKTIAGHLKNISGDVDAFNKALMTSPISEWAKICTYIGSNENIGQSISTYEFLLSGRLGFTSGLGLFRKRDYEITEQWIEKLKLQSLIKKDYFFLSDGEKQLVTIARAFIYETPLILLDEPTSNLDIPNKKIITELLHSLSKTENKLIIYTTHDYFISKDLCDRIWFINNQKEFISGNYSDLQLSIEKDFGIGQ